MAVQHGVLTEALVYLAAAEDPFAILEEFIQLRPRADQIRTSRAF
jgi:hypothetical protein